jgi:hypothetical protein
MAASLKKNMNVKESKELEDSDHLEEENGENQANENNGEVKTKKKKKKNKKKSTTASTEVNGQDPNHVGNDVKTKEEIGQDEKDDEDAVEGNLFKQLHINRLFVKEQTI